MDFISRFLNILDNLANLTYFDAIDMIKSENDIQMFKSGQIYLSPFTCIDQYNREGYQPLHYAIQSRNLLACEWILSESDVKINAITEMEQWNSAHLAVRNGFKDLLTRLIELGVDLDALDAEKLTPLTYAESDLEAQRWIQLTNLNFKTTTLGPLDRTYFHFFAQDSTPILLDHVINSAIGLIDKPDSTGTTALMLAAENGQTGALKKLIDVGARVDVTDAEGRTALNRAASAGQTLSCQLLLRQANEEEEVDDFVVDIDDEEELARRLKAQALLFISDNNGLTPLMSAVLNGHIETVRLLSKIPSKHLDIPNERLSTSDGNTALHYAVLADSPEMVSILLEAGAFADSVNRDGKSPLDLVPESLKDRFVDLLFVSC